MYLVLLCESKSRFTDSESALGVTDQVFLAWLLYTTCIVMCIHIKHLGAIVRRHCTANMLYNIIKIALLAQLRCGTSANDAGHPAYSQTTAMPTHHTPAYDSPAGLLRTSCWFSSEKVAFGSSAVTKLKPTMARSPALRAKGGRDVSRFS